MSDYPTTAPAPSMQRDLTSAYIAAGARVGSWAIVSAIVFRKMGTEAFAMLALVRSTIGLLSYTSLGLAPALVRMLAEIAADALKPRTVGAEAIAPPPRGEPAVNSPTDPSAASESLIIPYATLRVDNSPDRPVRELYASAQSLSVGLAVVALLCVYAYSSSIGSIHHIPVFWGKNEVHKLALWMGIGFIFRLMGEVPSALLQNNGRIALDNRLMAIGDLAWPIILLGWGVGGEPGLLAVGFSYAAGQCLCFGSRSVAVAWITRMPLFSFRRANTRLMWKIARFGSLISIAQLADFLYAPTDFILINRLLNPADVAIYAPAVQIDAGLLLLVGGMAAVLLPKTATAHTSGDYATVRRYYIRGTFTSIGLLVLSSLAVWIAARYLFFAWLGSEMRATQAILPLVLIHTVVGGSSAVGRSILLGMGKVKPFTIAVLIAGVSNVVLSYCFVKYLDLGLKGIVLGTVVVVLARCVIWQPWYVMRCLKSDMGVEPKRN